MKITELFPLMAVFFCMAAPLSAMPGEYSVSTGDTLWGIAGKYYNDTSKWTAIYDANKQTINDPHWIYPEQKIEIPGVEMASSAGAPPQETSKKEIIVSTAARIEEKQQEPAEQAEQNAEPEPEQKSVEAPVESAVEIATLKQDAAPESAKFTGDTFLVEGSFKYDGRVVGIKEPKTLIAQGDVVFIDIGLNKGLKKGAECYVFRKKGKVRTPGTNQTVGTQIVRVGLLKVTSEINAKSSAALVLRSYEPIIVGDYIKIIK